MWNKKEKKYARKLGAHWWHALGTPFDIFDIRYDTFIMHHASCSWVEDIAIDRLLWPFHFSCWDLAYGVWPREKYWNVCFCDGHNLFRFSSTETKIIPKMCNFALFSRCFWPSIFRYGYGLCAQHTHTQHIILSSSLNSLLGNILHLWHDFVSIKISNFFIYEATLLTKWFIRNDEEWTVFFFSSVGISHSKMDLSRSIEHFSYPIYSTRIHSSIELEFCYLIWHEIHSKFNACHWRQIPFIAIYRKWEPSFYFLLLRNRWPKNKLINLKSKQSNDK